jgi:magnesium chelatase family protein
MNPCECGYFGDPKRECRCSHVQVERYRNRISGPLLDRIDIHVEVPAVQYREMASNEPGEASAAIRQRVEQARAVQSARFTGHGRARCNARMSAKQIKSYCALDEAAEGLMKMAMTELNFSARAYDRILKVARTIADLDSQEQIGSAHVAEAIQYRTLDRNLWA